MSKEESLHDSTWDWELAGLLLGEMLFALFEREFEFDMEFELELA